jgi:hypothetical protein
MIKEIWIEGGCGIFKNNPEHADVISMKRKWGN